MTLQDHEDIEILECAAQYICHEMGQLLNDLPVGDLDCDDIVEKGKQLARIGEIIWAIRDNGKHLPGMGGEK